ncbi:hypothetical protein YC2023_062702 [Brassica napus]
MINRDGRSGTRSGSDRLRISGKVPTPNDKGLLYVSMKRKGYRALTRSNSDLKLNCKAKRIRESPSAKQYEYTFGGCIERLDFLEEVEQGSDLYLFAA